MIARRKEAREEAFRESYAIDASSVYNLKGAQAVCCAAESEGMPVILQTGSKTFESAGRLLASYAVVVAESSTAKVRVYLDNSRGLEEIGECLRWGYTSVMIDVSDLLSERYVGRLRERRSS